MSDYPAEWVEKAADAITVYCGNCKREGVNCDTCWAQARAVLDAVAPTIRADAWQEGYVDGLNDSSLAEGGNGWHENPYRTEASV